MTSLHEMDEFFDFEDAAHPVDHLEHPAPASFNIDLALRAHPKDPLAQINYFVDALPQDSFNFEFPGSGQDTAMMGPYDFTDFPRWIDGMCVPTKPCEYCSQRRIHCKVLKEGTRKGSCTSCVALAKPCSLTADLRSPIAQMERFPVSYTAEDKHQGSPQDLDSNSRSGSASDLVALKSSSENLAEAADNGNPKVGARFSREALRVLRTWLTSNHRHPYPSDEEKESLARQTGLNKTQITNWLANARRRGKVRAPRSTSPGPQQYANGMDIPRRGTPATTEMNPMERWAHSPPEHEPASVTAIAKAVSSSTFSSGRDSPFTSTGHTDDGSARSISHISSTSSVGTSAASSNGSFASAYSHKSRGSFGSFNSFGNRGRRRRRRQAPRAISPTTMRAPVRTYQCTFCTETFKTKHDWQRHEKSLHLSLERWVCSPDSPAKFCSALNRLACVYCAMPNPSPEHAEEHNHTSCAERSLEERTFYRKDHLRQHLNLVHDVKFQNWSMDSWKVATPEIRSRCGFCGIVMDSWSIRVEHLAEHFKGGKSMADWKGDWGFEEQVLGIVENGMPPYLIHDERNSPDPYQATRSDVQLGKNLEDHVKLWLVDYINDRVLAGLNITDDDLLVEAQRVVRKVDTEDNSPGGPEVSWFRDLVMLSGPSGATTQELGTTVSPNTSTTTIQLERINGQTPADRDSGLIKCEKERALLQYVKSRQALGLTPADSELQVEACKIIDIVEPKSNFQCKGAVQWFKYLITASTAWLAAFRRRVCLPRSSELAYEHIRSKDDKTIDYSVHNSYRLQREMKDWVQLQRAVGKTLSDEEIQSQARLIIYGTDDSWNQTVMDDISHLNTFKRQNGLAPSYDGGLPRLSEVGESPSSGVQTVSTNSPRSLHWDLIDRGIGLPSPLSTSDRPWGSPKDYPLYITAQNQPSTNTNPVQPLRYFLNDANCYGRLAKELTRFVMSCLSLNNPNQHIPSDAEIQNQARWVIYDDDDPWNQTAADNLEWLTRFKRDVGLAPAEEGPGLPPFGDTRPWTVKDGGSGFCPPYVKPKEGQLIAFSEDIPVSVCNSRTYNVSKETAGRFLRDLNAGRYQSPASVFCSRDLENGLNAYVEDCIMNRQIPSDDDLRAKGREILGVEHTAADEPKLLEQFKALHVLWHKHDNTNEKIIPGQQDDYSLPNFTSDVDMFAAYDQDLDSMDLSTDFSAGLDALSGGNEGSGEAEDEMGGLIAQMEFEKILGGSGATSSPLRRRASEKMAEKWGFSKPFVNGGGSA